MQHKFNFTNINGIKRKKHALAKTPYNRSPRDNNFMASDRSSRNDLRSRSTIKPVMFYRKNSSLCATPGVGEYDLDKSVESINGKSPRATISNVRRFDELEKTPGVGDYNLDVSTEQIKKKSPRATIGSSRRFIGDPIDRYKSATPCEYVQGPASMKPKMGTIGNAKRFVEPKEEDYTPGVGKYDLG